MRPRPSDDPVMNTRAILVCHTAFLRFAGRKLSRNQINDKRCSQIGHAILRYLACRYSHLSRPVLGKQVTQSAQVEKHFRSIALIVGGARESSHLQSALDPVSSGGTHATPAESLGKDKSKN